MLFLTRWFGVTGSQAERNLGAEQARIQQIVEESLELQAKAAADQHRRIGRGTHVKGVTVRAQFEIFDVTAGCGSALAARLAKGIFAKPGVYPALVRFGNADSRSNSDLKPDVRSLSFSVDLTGNGTVIAEGSAHRQDFSMQNATTLPINDSSAFVAIIKVLTASNPGKGLLSLSFRDKLRVLRILTLVQLQARQKIEPYQQLRYWSTVPFRYGPTDVVKHSAIPSPDNLASPLERSNPNALKDELIRHIDNDAQMSSFDFGVQFLNTEKMTYWGKPRDADFWIENASVAWHEEEAPFHVVARLTLLPKSQLQQDAADATYIDVTGNSTPDSAPLGSINRARSPAEVASRKARIRADRGSEPEAP